MNKIIEFYKEKHPSNRKITDDDYDDYLVEVAAIVKQSTEDEQAEFLEWNSNADVSKEAYHNRKMQE